MVAVPSRRRPALVASLAEQISQIGRLPLLGTMDLVHGGPVGEPGGNSAFRLANVWGRLGVGPELRTALDQVQSQTPGPVLLVDDLADSRWTLTVAARRADDHHVARRVAQHVEGKRARVLVEVVDVVAQALEVAVPGLDHRAEHAVVVEQDAVRQLAGVDPEDRAPARHVSPGGIGLAVVSQQRPAVLLVQSIEKSPRHLHDGHDGDAPVVAAKASAQVSYRNRRKYAGGSDQDPHSGLQVRVKRMITDEILDG